MRDEWEKLIVNYKEIIVYGAGKVGTQTVRYIKKINPNAHIVVAITDKNVGLKVCEGIQAVCIFDLYEYTQTALVIIAAFDKFHGTMTYIVDEIGFQNVVKVNLDIYERMYAFVEGNYKVVKEKIRKLPINIYVYCLKKVKLRNTIVFRTHTLYPDGSCENIYRYMKSNGLLDRYKIVWMVKNRKEFKDDKNCKFIDVDANFKCRNLFYLITSKYLVWENDPILKFREKQKSIHITHGMPTIKNVHGIINIPEETDRVLISSENVMDLQAYQMCMNKNKYIVCGLPRLDDLFARENELMKLDIREGKNIIWMPTFRKLNYSTRVDSEMTGEIGLPLIQTKKDMYYLNKILKKSEMNLIIKIHPLQDTSVIDKESYSNIKIITNTMLKEKKINLYKMIGETQALLTDYSSVSFDYLLLDRPIGYIIDDMSEYKRGFALDNIYEFMPGPKITVFQELIEFFMDIKEENDEWKVQRNELKDFCHYYQDAHNTERFWKRLIEESECL